MKNYIIPFVLFIGLHFSVLAQNQPDQASEKEVYELSMNKWKWMAEKDITLQIAMLQNILKVIISNNRRFKCSKV